MSAARRRLLILSFAATVLLLGAPAAATSEGPVSVDPADGAELDEVPAAVSFTFDEPVSDPAYASVIVDGHPVTLPAGDPIVDGERVVVDLSGVETAGRDWLVAYRVPAQSGVLDGSTRFSVPTAEVNDEPIAQGVQEDESVWGTPWPWAGVVALVLVLAVVLARGGRRERNAR
ncbi:copper resistance protein CopC [Aeromicrobium sp. YIM 150415]|uniref:copper resistance CopC family protein n=1 Tax=Aeromicrobium sp. YIM 150415 TaxID=2803912 RepID=UPI001965C7B3|nr:copper resistance protein CopC [Aeromicrobium sp. YIM 150415]MBM9465321.1 copper resistance protein CopC [Aeromicrobium sp. YIM 150415]